MIEPVKLTSIERSLGDFLDYSNHPKQGCNPQALSKDNLLSASSIIGFNSLNKEVLLPTYKQSSGWGRRHLSRKEIFSLWGYGSVADKGISTTEILELMPLQPLQLCINSTQAMKELDRSTSKGLGTPITATPPATTFLVSIGRTLSHNWIDPNVIASSTSKADKSPVPQAMWDKRIELVFSNKTGVKNLIVQLRNGLLRLYRRRLLHSFIFYLRTCYNIEYSNYLNGQRLAWNGGMLLSTTFTLP